MRYEANHHQSCVLQERGNIFLHDNKALRSSLMTKMGQLGKKQGEEKKIKHWASKLRGKRKVRILQPFLLLPIVT